MKASSRRFALFLMASVAAVTTFGLARNAKAGGQVTIGVTETIASHNPYADSISMGYAIWCQVYGCLGIYDYEKGDYVGMLVDRWEVDKADKNVWTFHLKRGLKRQNDGVELTADDVVHSVNRINNDPLSKQKQNVSPIKEVVALDKYTVKMVTKEPTASLLEFIFDRVIISGEGSLRQARRTRGRPEAPWGWGPYKLKDLVIGQRIVLEKDSSHPRRQTAKSGYADLQHHARGGAARDGSAQQRNPDRAVHSAASRRTRQRRSERRAASDELGRDHVPGDEPQVQAMGQSEASPGGLLRHRPRPHHQERA